ncbi:MAG: type IV pilin N-terminal domain-containing protein [Methanoculleus sp.]|jgi:FlaG/FlaF family flagellin (archaellin)|uniref:Type IV pilin N-terminal domain-containing protein n=3 Tax=Methanoculleus TaxID=45989 RepID=A0ABD8A5T3_9EURY|nr:type IV pilin N-terminal domain-containing protein [Methanoculleus sp.]WOX54901.1 type IV pilin N-terminal domain-containing protein [Methanoculleus palmolei]
MENNDMDMLSWKEHRCRGKEHICAPVNDDAVSPVVGVMLMLVVTIIIAAIVSSFAGGLGSSSSKAPAATLAIKMVAGPNDTNVTIEHLGGDPLATKDLQIVSSYTVPEMWGAGHDGSSLQEAGRVIKHTIDGRLAPIPENALDQSAAGYPFTPQVTNDDSIVSTRTADQTFGTAILVPGSRLTFDRDNFLGFETDQRCVYDWHTKKSAGYGFGEGVTVHVTIIHTGSGSIIYDRDVIVPW